MASVYLETSVVSACVSDRTDAKSIYRRETSLEWWDTQRLRHELYVSPEVSNELSHPDYPHREKALSFIEGVPLLAINEEVEGLASVFVNELVMPSPVAGDALHVAIAAVHRIEYLLSWNVRHLANPNKRRHLQVICIRAGYVTPEIITPDLLWEDD